MAQRDGAQVIVLHVLPLSDLVIGEYPIVMVDQLQADLTADAEKRLQAWKDKQSVKVESLVLWGNPALDICRGGAQGRSNRHLHPWPHRSRAPVHGQRGGARGAPCAVFGAGGAGAARLSGLAP